MRIPFIKKNMKALLVIDVQKDYFPGGRFELFEANETLQRVKKLIQRCRKEKIPVIYIKHLMDAPAPFFEVGTSGAEIHDEIEPLQGEVVVEKRCPSCFLNTNLQEVLQRLSVQELLVCGMMTHMCVDTAVRAASDLGYKVTVFEDACTTRDLSWNGETIPAKMVNAMYMSSLNGAFATIATVD